MKETGIIMSGNHPKLILDGIKTQTRRVITPHNSEVGEGRVDWSKFCWDGSAIYKEELTSGIIVEHRAPLPFVDHSVTNWDYLHIPYDWAEDMSIFRVYPRWEAGDRLWVKEVFYTESGDIWYKANGQSAPMPIKWKSSMFMPRWASRILLEINRIRVERLQEITEEDCRAEGVSEPCSPFLMRTEYKELWDSLNTKRGFPWESNPWVWVISFKVVKE
jgi:hypothetical protein